MGEGVRSQGILVRTMTKASNDQAIHTGRVRRNDISILLIKVAVCFLPLLAHDRLPNPKEISPLTPNTNHIRQSKDHRDPNEALGRPGVMFPHGGGPVPGYLDGEEGGKETVCWEREELRRLWNYQHDRTDEIRMSRWRVRG